MMENFELRQRLFLTFGTTYPDKESLYLTSIQEIVDSMN